MSSTFVRLRKYDKKGGQPHKDVTIAHLNMKFIAGKFMRVPDKIKDRLIGYLKKQYPEDNPSLPCLFEFADESKLQEILKYEAKLKDQENRAALLGISLSELRQREREDRHQVVEYDRMARIDARGKSQLQEMAEELGKEETESEALANQAYNEDADKPFIEEEDNPWGDVRDELGEENAQAEKDLTQEEIQELLSEDIPAKAPPKKETPKKKKAVSKKKTSSRKG